MFVKKTKNKALTLALTGLLTGALLTGCATNTLENSGENAVGIMNLNAKELEAPTYNEEYTAPSAVARGANDFAFRLSTALVENAGDENFVCSPYSVWIPLAALVNATDEANRADLLTALGAAGISVEDLNTSASRMLYSLTKEKNKEYEEYYDPLKIANAIFVDDDVTLNKDFAQTFLDYYRGNAMNVDFASATAVEAVNQWASDNTEGLITDIIEEFDPDTVAAIANAIYFSDRWSWEFEPESTTEGIFHSPTGEKNAYFMVREDDDQTYYEDDQVQAMPLEFTTGGGMYIILPKDGDAKALLSSMTNEYFEEIQNDSISAAGKLLLPRFSADSGMMELKDALMALGVPLFDEALAPLTGGLLEDENLPVWLSSVAHKAVIQVDEKGTTAAAVTLMMAYGGVNAPEPTEPFEMNCNRPFVFVLYGNTFDGGNQVLFTGIVNEP